MSTQELKQDVKQLARDTEQFASNVGTHSAAFGTAMKDKVSPIIGSARDSIYAVGHEVKERASSAVKKTDAYAHEHPWKSVGVAALAGLAIGALLTRRR